MATKAAQKKENKDTGNTVTHLVNNFVMAHRKIIITVFIALITALIVLVVVSVVTERRNTAALEKVEQAFADWERSRMDGVADSETEETVIQTLVTVAEKNSRSLAGARAWLTVAEIYFSRSDWKTAAGYYESAARAAPRAYTAPLAWFNAGVSADNAGDVDAAVIAFTQAASHASFAWNARAWFNLGRVQEQAGRTAEAVDAYQKLAALFPDNEYTKLAKSRLIVLNQ